MTHRPYSQCLCMLGKFQCNFPKRLVNTNHSKQHLNETTTSTYRTWHWLHQRRSATVHTGACSVHLIWQCDGASSLAQRCHVIVTNRRHCCCRSAVKHHVLTALFSIFECFLTFFLLIFQCFSGVATRYRYRLVTPPGEYGRSPPAMVIYVYFSQYLFVLLI